MTNGGITNDAAVPTVSVVNKQTKAAISYPQRVSLPLPTLRVVSLLTLSDAMRVEALKSANCASQKKRLDTSVRTEKNDIQFVNKQFVSLSVILLLVILLWSIYSVNFDYSSAAMDWTLVQDVFLHLPG